MEHDRCGSAPRSLLAILGLAGAAAALSQEDQLAWSMPVTGAAATFDDEHQLAYRVAPEMRKKYGRYPPWCRLNVDQVPLPFVNDMEKTYAERGSKRVVINQLGPSLRKRQATGQVCFRPAVPPPAGCTTAEARKLYDKYLQEQPAPCILFRGMGNITDLIKFEGTPEGYSVVL